MASTSYKRKSSGAVHGNFNPQWSSQYFFQESDGKAECVVCWQTISTIKHYNIARHYKNHHAESYVGIVHTQEREDLFKKLRDAGVQVASDATISTEATRASYKVAALIAKHMKSFSEGEFVKDCLVATAECVCPEQVDAFQSVSLSRSTITRRIECLARDIRMQLSDRMANFIAYSLALDESTDVSDTAQLVIFIRGVDKDLKVTEEMLELVSLKGTTTGEDIFGSLEKAVEDNTLPWDKLISVATDGAAAMRGTGDGMAGRLNRKLKAVGVQHSVRYVHCFIHRENLCAQSLKMKNVMAVVVKTVNTIRSHGLKHRQFQEFLADIDHEYRDIPYFSEVRWLSRGKVLERFFILREEIAIFMELLGQPVPQLSDDSWVADLAFLCDVVSHLNTLNTAMQGRDIIITHLVDTLRAFQQKMTLWIGQMESAQLAHFPSLHSLNPSWQSQELESYKDLLSDLLKEFDRRFEDLSTLEAEFDIFATPFSVQPPSAPSDFQLELIDLQHDRELKDKYRSRQSLVDFYSTFPQERFPRLFKVAAKALCMFGSTYRCEQFFSLMKLEKPRLRNRLTDEHLHSVLRIASASSMTPNIDRLVKEQRCRKSN